MTKFKSSLPCPFVDLPSGTRVAFIDHEADVDKDTAAELREVLDDPALAALDIAEVGGSPASSPAPSTKPSKASKAPKAPATGESGQGGEPGEGSGQEPPDEPELLSLEELKKLKRPDLNAMATVLGVEDPEDLPNIGAVADAIVAARESA